MRIEFSPVDGLPDVSIAKQGDSLSINGEVFDFSILSEGDVLPVEAIRSTWFAGPVKRVGGELIVPVFLPLPPNYSQAQAFPKPLLGVKDGPVPLPKGLSAPIVTQEASA